MKIGRITIDPSSVGDPLAARISGLLPDVPRGEGRRAPRSGTGREEILRDTGDGGGRRLVLARNPGRFVKDFPRTPGAPPCGEKYIVAIQGCPFDCSYCYLRSYLGHQDMIVFTNTRDMKEEIEEALRAPGLSRITTGEMSDSLALDHLTGTLIELLPLFEGSGVLLEARTKSANIGSLLRDPGLAPKGRAGGSLLSSLMVTWTISPPDAIAAEERGTAPLEARISAMERAAGAGIGVGVRFDPVIPAYYSQSGYASLVEELAGRIRPGMLRRFELGILRFPPGLWEKVRQAGPRSPLFRGEYFRDGEGKIRLYRPERVRIYRELASSIRARFPDAALELSMEDIEIWEDSGISPPECGPQYRG